MGFHYLACGRGDLADRFGGMKAYRVLMAQAGDVVDQAFGTTTSFAADEQPICPGVTVHVIGNRIGPGTTGARQDG